MSIKDLEKKIEFLTKIERHLTSETSIGFRDDNLNLRDKRSVSGVTYKEQALVNSEKAYLENIFNEVQSKFESGIEGTLVNAEIASSYSLKGISYALAIEKNETKKFREDIERARQALESQLEKENKIVQEKLSKSEKIISSKGSLVDINKAKQEYLETILKRAGINKEKNKYAIACKFDSLNDAKRTARFLRQEIHLPMHVEKIKVNKKKAFLLVSDKDPGKYLNSEFKTALKIEAVEKNVKKKIALDSITPDSKLSESARKAYEHSFAELSKKLHELNHATTKKTFIPETKKQEIASTCEAVDFFIHEHKNGKKSSREVTLALQEIAQNKNLSVKIKGFFHGNEDTKANKIIEIHLRKLRGDLAKSRLQDAQAMEIKETQTSEFSQRPSHGG